MTYTIKRLNWAAYDRQTHEFILNAAHELERLYPLGYNWRKINIFDLVENYYFLMCYRDDAPVGFLLAQKARSFFDPDVIILKQVVLYGLTNTRASLLLLKAFIDIGRESANHVVTMIGEKTNIKPRTLERLGFEKLETAYRIKLR